MFRIVTTPNPVLTGESKQVKKFDEKLRKIIADMEKTLLATTDPKGVGLAAPQVGLPLRIFLARPAEKSKTLVFINPVIKEFRKETGITKKRKTKRQLLEGCLSIPTIWSNVERNKELILFYQNEKGEKFTKSFKGFMATIIQHEIDHLNGILFTKRAIEQNQQLYKSKKNEEGEDEFEEIKI